MWSYDVLWNWRVCHGYPINTFQATLRARVKKIDLYGIVVQRLKRTPSMLGKLRREKGMSLSRMQDIGGVRAIVTDMDCLQKLLSLYQNRPLSHALIKEFNYIESPKPSGYRSVHLIYRYNSHQNTNYNGLLIEVQLRTKLQHSWATAVETMGTFLQHSLKSSEGPDEWLSFFSLVGSAFSQFENGPPVPGYEHLTFSETKHFVKSEAIRLGVFEKLVVYSEAANSISINSTRVAAYYLLILDLRSGTPDFQVHPFSYDQLEDANRQYSELEKDIGESEKMQVVLVRSGSIEALKTAYPNYFLDTREFIVALRSICISP